MTDDLIMKDRRAEPRRRTLFSGKLAFADSYSADGVIRDRSYRGARVKISGDALPKNLVLVSVSNGVAYEAEVVWRRREEAGLRLKNAQKLDEPCPREFVYARKLWTEAVPRQSD